MAKRLEPYLDARHSNGAPEGHDTSPLLDELAERAATLVTVMPPRPRRAMIEELVCPNDRERGRRAVSALVERGVLAEDERGCLLLAR